MANPFYTDANTVQPTGTARSSPVTAEFAKLQTAFDLVDTQLTRRVKIPTGAGNEIIDDVSQRALKAIGFDAAGDIGLISSLGTWRGDWVTATAYAQQDIVRDPVTPFSLYIANSAHTSPAAFDGTEKAANWTVIIDLTELARAEEIKYNWTVVTANVNPAVSGADYAVDLTGGAFSITLPAAPADNDHIRICHVAGDIATLTIGRNGKEIMGSATDLTFSSTGDNDATNACFDLVYIDSTHMWRIKPV